MKNFTICLVVFALISTSARAQNVNIPDPNLLEVLIDHGVDTNEDLLISFEEAAAVDSLTLLNGINDMTGIEAFTSLRYLDLYESGLGHTPNVIAHLDVSSNTSLEYLDCSYIELDSMVIGNNDKLRELNCQANVLSHIDLSACPDLRLLNCYGNPLVEIDISSCRQLETIYLDEIFDPFVMYVWMLPFPPEGLGIYGLEAEVQYIDVVPPEVILSDDHVYLPGSMEFTSNEDGIAYLVNQDTLDAVEEIRTFCLDSLEVKAGLPVSFDLADYNGPDLWVQAADGSLNLSVPSTFEVYGVGIEHMPDRSVEIFPNPASELITLHSKLNSSYSVEIADISGRIVFATTYTGESLSIDIREFNRGIYLLRISDGQGVHVQKFIKR